MGTIEAWLASFPTISLVLQSALPKDDKPSQSLERLELYPRDYFVMDSGELCIGLEYTIDRIILGIPFLRNFYVTFDRGQKLITMTRSNCSKDPTASIDKYYEKHAEEHKNETKENAAAEVRVKEGYMAQYGLLEYGLTGLLLLAIGLRFIFWGRFRDRHGQTRYSYQKVNRVQLNI